MAKDVVELVMKLDTSGRSLEVMKLDKALAVIKLVKSVSKAYDLPDGATVWKLSLMCCCVYTSALEALLARADELVPTEFCSVERDVDKVDTDDVVAKPAISFVVA